MTKQRSKRLIRLTLVLFLLEVITFPFVVKLTYSGTGNGVDRMLTYTPGKLTWDSDKKILPDGTAVLSLFSDSYRNAKSDNKDDILAPGADMNSIVRLRNDSNHDIQYTAVCYKIQSGDMMNVKGLIKGNGLKDTKDVPPSNSYQPDQVTHAVSGTLSSNQLLDFDVNVIWDFEINDSVDLKDTHLGNNSADGNPATLKIGFIVYVTDLNYNLDPIPPTGDRSPLWLYLILITVSGFVLILLLIERRRQDKKEEKNLLFEEEMHQNE